MGELDTDRAFFADFVGRPDGLVEALDASVQVVGAVVGGQDVFLTVEGKACLGDAVGVSSGHTAEEGVPGEISVRGETVFSEYWRRKKITRESFQDGWFKTGDVAIVEAGYYRILGRSSVDIIKTGGYKLSALETEEVLRKHPKIGECAVVGIEDDEWGERVSAVVVLEPGCSLELEELRMWAADKLAIYKIPSRLLVVTELPRNAMGKVRKSELRSLFQIAG